MSQLLKSWIIYDPNLIINLWLFQDGAFKSKLMPYIDGLMQERCNSIANALELRLSCTNPSIW